MKKIGKIGALIFGVALSLIANAGLEEAKPWLGIGIDTDPKGVLVKQVISNTPAEKSGMKEGDIVTNIDGKPIKTPKELIDTVRAKGVGFTVKVDFLRGGKAMSKSMSLEAKPDDLEMMNTRLKGKPAYDFNLPVAFGKQSGELKKHKGKVVVMQFWATWCPACRSTHPTLSEFAKSEESKGLVVLAISDEESKTINDYLSKAKVHFTGLVDTKSQVTADYFVPALPTTVVIDREGIVRHVSIGGGSYFDDALTAAKAELAKKK